jgi:hypothetical protein
MDTSLLDPALTTTPARMSLRSRNPIVNVPESPRDSIDDDDDDNRDIIDLDDDEADEGVDEGEDEGEDEEEEYYWDDGFDPVEARAALDHPRYSRIDKEQFMTPHTPAEHICPFAYPGVLNPCRTHNTPRARKDAIRVHLFEKRHFQDGTSHLADNAIWQTWIVQRYYLPKRIPMTPAAKKRKVKAYNAGYYAKRAKQQKEQLPAWKAQLTSGEITRDEFKKRVIGRERRKVVEAEELEKQVGIRLQQARTDLGEGAGQYEELVTELREAKELLATSRRELMALSKLVIGNWNPDRQTSNFHPMEDGRWDYERVEVARGFHWPTKPSIDAFYTIAALLVPVDQTEQVHRIEAMQDMKNRLRTYLQAQRTYYAGPAEWDNVEKVFEESCGLIRCEEERHAETGEVERWYEGQKALWAAALDEARKYYQPVFAGKTPLEIWWEVDEAGIFLENEQGY